MLFTCMSDQHELHVMYVECEEGGRGDFGWSRCLWQGMCLIMCNHSGVWVCSPGDPSNNRCSAAVPHMLPATEHPALHCTCLLCASQTWTSPGTWEFTLSGLTLAPGSSGSNGSSVRYSLTCKPAAADGLDEDQPFFVGVPSWLALSESTQWGRNYFFARLEPEQQQHQRAQPFVGDSVEQLHTRQSEQLCRSGSNGAAAAGATTPHSSGSNVSGSNMDSGVMVLPAPTGSTAAAAAPAEGFVWLPRGHAAAGGCGSSAGSNVGSSAVSLVSSAASSPLSSSRSLGGFHISGAFSTTSSNSSSSGSAARLGKVPPSVASVATNNSSGSVPSHVGALVRGLPIPGLVMGPLLGRGSYGRVYRGLLKGRPVAVKVRRGGFGGVHARAGLKLDRRVGGGAPQGGRVIYQQQLAWPSPHTACIFYAVHELRSPLDQYLLLCLKVYASACLVFAASLLMLLVSCWRSEAQKP